MVHTVGAEHVGARVDTFVSEVTELSRSGAVKLIKTPTVLEELIDSVILKFKIDELP